MCEPTLDNEQLRGFFGILNRADLGMFGFDRVLD